MDQTKAMALLLVTCLGGCGGGGGEATATEQPDPVVALGSVVLTRSAHPSTATGDVQASIGHNVNGTHAIPVFDALALTESDVGRTHVIASADDDPDFLPFVAVITNGVDDRLSVRLRSGDGNAMTIRPESELIQGTSGPLAPDFRRATITRIEFTLDALSIETDDFPDGSRLISARATMRFVFFGVR